MPALRGGSGCGGFGQRLFASTSTCSALASVTNSGSLVLKNHCTPHQSRLAHRARRRAGKMVSLPFTKPLDFYVANWMGCGYWIVTSKLISPEQHQAAVLVRRDAQRWFCAPCFQQLTDRINHARHDDGADAGLVAVATLDQLVLAPCIFFLSAVIGDAGTRTPDNAPSPILRASPSAITPQAAVAGSLSSTRTAAGSLWRKRGNQKILARNRLKTTYQLGSDIGAIMLVVWSWLNAICRVSHPYPDGGGVDVGQRQGIYCFTRRDGDIDAAGFRRLARYRVSDIAMRLVGPTRAHHVGLVAGVWPTLLAASDSQTSCVAGTITRSASA